MKQCPHCGIGLHESANFCPYCMRKLLVTETMDIPKEQHRKWLLIPVTVVLAIAVLLSVLLLNQNLFSTQEESRIDYAAYPGLWLTKDYQTIEECAKSGSTSVQINTINDSIAEVCITTIGAFGKIATTDTIYGRVEGDTIYFRFQNDGWMSSGEGTIILIGDTIYTEIIYNYVDPYAQWQLEGADIYHKVASYETDDPS